MPRYAVDFLAEIKETATNLDDCSDSVDLLTIYNSFTGIKEEPTEENNVVSAHMGNGQCCFKRYPGYQAHRHVVVSRGVQCSEAMIGKITEFDKDADNNGLFYPRATERGDAANDNYKDAMVTSENLSFTQQRAIINSSLNFQIIKGKPEIFTPSTEDPPELRESSKFFNKRHSVDIKKSRKYTEEDIDSLSATISNYSLHDRLQRLDTIKVNESLDKNNHQSNTVVCMTPVPRQRQISYKGSTDAIRGSTTRTLTCRSHDNRILNKNDYIDNQSSDSYTSFAQGKDHKVGLFTNSADITESTPMEIEKERNTLQYNANVEILDREILLMPTMNDETFQMCTTNTSQLAKARILTTDKRGGMDVAHAEKPFKSNSDSKCSSSVTFMKGSEELQNNEVTKSMEVNNINVLRRKQKFLMKHTRNNSKLASATNSDFAHITIAPELSSHVANIQIGCTHVATKSHTPIDYLQTLPDSSIQKPSSRITQYTTMHDSNRNACASRNSNHSDIVTHTPATKSIKMKRTVSFDKHKMCDPASRSLSDQKILKSESTNQTYNRNTVRAKYCSNKVIKQRFYIPESANIECILRDPSDRRIKAICDRHNCDIEIYSKVPKSGFLKNIIVLAAPNNENLRKCVRSLDYSMCWCLTAQLP